MKKKEYGEVIRYTFFGILTVCVSMLTYFIFNILGTDYRISNILSIILTKIFAYFTNKKYVFMSKTQNLKDTVMEMLRFMVARVSTGVVDFLGQIILVEVILVDDLIGKGIMIIIVTILNYALSKKAVFVLERTNEDKEQKVCVK